MIRWDERLRAMSPEKRAYAFDGLVHNVLSSQRWDRLEELLLNVFFIENKAQAEKVFDLLDDYTKSIKTVTSENKYYRFYQLIAEAIRNDIHFINRHPAALFQCLWNTCWWYDSPERNKYCEFSGDRPVEGNDQQSVSIPKMYKLLEQWRNQKEKASSDFTWLRSLRPPLKPLGRGQTLTLNGHLELVRHLAFSTDGQILASNSSDGEVKTWDVRSGRELSSQSGIVGWPRAIAFSKGVRPIVVTGMDSKAVAYDAKYGEELATFLVNNGSIVALAISHDADFIVSELKEGELYVWDYRNEKRVYFPRRLKGLRSRTKGLVITDDGQRVIWISEDAGLCTWDVLSDEVTKHEIEMSNILCHAISFDGNRFAWGDLNGINLYNIEDPCVTKRIGDEHPSFCRSLAWSPDGRIIASAYADGTVIAWDTVTGNELRRYDIGDGNAQCMILSSYGHSLALSCLGPTITIHDLSQEHEEITSADLGNHITTLSMSSQSPILVSGALNGTIQIWNAVDGRQIGCLRGHEGPVNGVILLDNIGCIYSCGDDKTIRVWDISSKSEKMCLRGHKKPVNSIDVSEDGSYLISCSNDTTVRFWSIENKQELACLEGHKDFVQCALLSGNCTKAVSGSYDHTLRVWDLKEAKELFRIEGLGEFLSGWPAAMFLPDNKRLVLVWGDGTIRVWDSEKREELKRLTAPSAGITGLNTSMDGKRILAVSRDNNVFVWDSNTLQLLTRYKGILRTEGDACSVTDEQRCYLWRAVPYDLETAIVSTFTGQTVAWCPCEELSIMLSGKTWVCTSDNSIQMFTIESNLKKTDTAGKIPKSTIMKFDDLPSVSDGSAKLFAKTGVETYTQQTSNTQKPLLDEKTLEELGDLMNQLPEHFQESRKNLGILKDYKNILKIIEGEIEKKHDSQEQSNEDSGMHSVDVPEDVDPSLN